MAPELRSCALLGFAEVQKAFQPQAEMQKEMKKNDYLKFAMVAGPDVCVDHLHTRMHPRTPATTKQFNLREHRAG